MGVFDGIFLNSVNIHVIGAQTNVFSREIACNQISRQRAASSYDVIGNIVVGY